MRKKISALAILSLLLVARVASEELDGAQRAKVEGKLQALKAWGKDAIFVAAVRKHNEGLLGDAKEMNNERWKGLGIGDDLVRAFARNGAVDQIKALKDPTISECFISGADGKKVAFLQKTTAWNHTGKAKHDDPMRGKTWIGPVELDESSGVKQIQVSFPIYDGGKVIGSIVVGLNINRL